MLTTVGGVGRCNVKHGLDDGALKYAYCAAPGFCLRSTRALEA